MRGPRNRPPKVTNGGAHCVEVDAATVGACFGITARRVQALVKAGVLPRPIRHGVYDLAAAVRAWVAHQIADRETDATTAEAKRKFWNHRAAREEMEARKIAAALLDRDDVSETVSAMAIRLAASLDGVAGRLAGKVAGLAGDRAAVRELLFAEHRAIRERMANDLEGLRREREEAAA